MNATDSFFLLVAATFVAVLGIASGQSEGAVVVDDHFVAPSIDMNNWITRIPQNPPTDDIQSGVSSTNLRVVNSGAGGFWGNGVGIWSNGASPSTPLFNRPTNAAGEVNVYFFGVDPQGILTRAAWGLSSFNATGEGTGTTQSQFNFPDGDGQNEFLSYSFWIRPDDSQPNDNWVRTKTVNNAAAATNGASEQIWSTSGPARDFRIRVLHDDIEWYTRLVADPTQSPTNPWLLIGNEPVSNPQDGSEPGGRDSFRVFVHASAAGNDGAAVWNDADLLFNRILVTEVVPEPTTISLLILGAAVALAQRKRK